MSSFQVVVGRQGVQSIAKMRDNSPPTIGGDAVRHGGRRSARWSGRVEKARNGGSQEIRDFIDVRDARHVVLVVRDDQDHLSFLTYGFG